MSKMRVCTSIHWQPNNASRPGRPSLEVTGSFHVIAGGTTGSARDLCRTSRVPHHRNVTVNASDVVAKCRFDCLKR